MKAKVKLGKRLESWAIKAALGAVDWESPQLAAFVSILLESSEIEKGCTCQPNLTAEQRAYNCGRLAMAEDLRGILEQAWQQAQAANKV